MVEQHAKHDCSKQSVTSQMKATPQQTTRHVSPLATAVRTVTLASQAIPNVS
jgi:hypothetical protein